MRKVKQLTASLLIIGGFLAIAPEGFSPREIVLKGSFNPTLPAYSATVPENPLKASKSKLQELEAKFTDYATSTAFYLDAQAKIQAFETAYDTEINNLPESVTKEQAVIDKSKAIRGSIQEAKDLFNLLTSGQYQAAQENLKSKNLYTKPIDTTDGPGLRGATREYLEQLAKDLNSNLEQLEPLIKSPTPTPTPTPPLTPTPTPTPPLTPGTEPNLLFDIATFLLILVNIIAVMVILISMGVFVFLIIKYKQNIASIPTKIKEILKSKDIEELNNSYQELSLKINEMETKIEGIITKLKANSTVQPSDLEEEHNMLESDSNQSQEELQNSREQLEPNYRQLEADKQQLTREKEQLEADKQQLTREKEQLEENNQQLTREKEQLEENNQQQLAQQKERLEAEKQQQLAQQKERLEAEKQQQLAQQKERLEAEKQQQLAQQKERLQETNNEQSLKISELTQEIVQLESQLQQQDQNDQDDDTIDPPGPQPPPNQEIPEQLVYLFNSNPQSLLQQGYQHNEVTESQKSFSQRRNSVTKEVLLDKQIIPGQGDFWIISAENNSYLFPKGKRILGSLKTSAKALFEGYKSGDEREFTLVKPAKVAPVGTASKWKLVEKGELKYQ